MNAPKADEGMNKYKKKKTSMSGLGPMSWKSMGLLGQMARGSVPA